MKKGLWTKEKKNEKSAYSKLVGIIGWLTSIKWQSFVSSLISFVQWNQNSHACALTNCILIDHHWHLQTYSLIFFDDGALSKKHFHMG